MQNHLMPQLISTGRKRVGLTQKQLGNLTFQSERDIQRLEAGDKLPPPELSCGLRKELKLPPITAVHCFTLCPIGATYHYPYLDKVSLAPSSVIAKFNCEDREAQAVREEILEILLNKRPGDICTTEEIQRLRQFAPEFVDLGHVIFMLLHMLDYYCGCDFHEQLMRGHKGKIVRNGYYSGRSAEPLLQIA